MKQQFILTLISLIFLLFHMYYSALLLHEQQPPIETHKVMLKNFQLHARKNTTTCCNPSSLRGFGSIELQHRRSVQKCKEVLGGTHTEQIKQHKSSNLDGINCDPNLRKDPHVQLINKTKMLLKIKECRPNFTLENTPNHKKLVRSKKFFHKNNNSLSIWSKNYLSAEKKNGVGSLLSFEHQSPIHYTKRSQTPQSYRRKDSSPFQQRKASQVLNPQHNLEIKNDHNLLLNISIKQQKQNLRKSKEKQDWIQDYINQKLKKSDDKVETKEIYNKLHLRHRHSYIRGEFINNAEESSNKVQLQQKPKDKHKEIQQNQQYNKQANMVPLQRSVSRQSRRHERNTFGRPNTTAEKQRPHPEQIEQKLEPW